MRQAKQFLLALLSLSKVQQKALLKTADKKQRLALRELVANLLAGNIPIGTKRVSILNKHKHVLRKLAKKNLSNPALLKCAHIIVLFVKLIRPFLDAL